MKKIEKMLTKALRDANGSTINVFPYQGSAWLAFDRARQELTQKGEYSKDELIRLAAKYY